MKKSLLFSFFVLMTAQVTSASFLGAIKNFATANKSFVTMCFVGAAVQGLRLHESEIDYRDKTTDTPVYFNKTKGNYYKHERNHEKKLIQVDVDAEHVKKNRNHSDSWPDFLFSKVCSDKKDEGFISRFKGGVIIALFVGCGLYKNKTGSFPRLNSILNY